MTNKERRRMKMLEKNTMPLCFEKMGKVGWRKGANKFYLYALSREMCLLVQKIHMPPPNCFPLWWQMMTQFWGHFPQVTNKVIDEATGCHHIVSSSLQQSDGIPEWCGNIIFLIDVRWFTILSTMKMINTTCT